MVTRIGLVGLGFMGKFHYNEYAKMKNAKVVAICDVDPKKRAGDTSAIGGNMGGDNAKMDFSGITMYEKIEDMVKDPNIDVIDLTVPTYLHCKLTLIAFAAGKHVFCEKPMALDAKECKIMIDASKKYKKKLFIGHCIRYWPAYAKAMEIINSKKYGKLLSATFRRVSPTPIWSWQNWLQDNKKSKLCAMDLHIHDADFILYCFGKPKAVTSSSSGFFKNRIDHIITTYEYGNDVLVSAEGAWEYSPTFPFSMTFAIGMEKASLNFGANLALHHKNGKTEIIKISDDTGYTLELKDFVNCIQNKKDSKVVSPDSAMNSVKLIDAEMKSALTKKTLKTVF